MIGFGITLFEIAARVMRPVTAAGRAFAKTDYVPTLAL